MDPAQNVLFHIATISEQFFRSLIELTRAVNDEVERAKYLSAIKKASKEFKEQGVEHIIPPNGMSPQKFEDILNNFVDANGNKNPIHFVKGVDENGCIVYAIPEDRRKELQEYLDKYKEQTPTKSEQVDYKKLCEENPKIYQAKMSPEQAEIFARIASNYGIEFSRSKLPDGSHQIAFSAEEPGASKCIQFLQQSAVLSLTVEGKIAKAEQENAERTYSRAKTAITANETMHFVSSKNPNIEIIVKNGSFEVIEPGRPNRVISLSGNAAKDLEKLYDLMNDPKFGGKPIALNEAEYANKQAFVNQYRAATTMTVDLKEKFMNQSKVIAVSFDALQDPEKKEKFLNAINSGRSWEDAVMLVAPNNPKALQQARELDMLSEEDRNALKDTLNEMAEALDNIKVQEIDIEMPDKDIDPFKVDPFKDEKDDAEL